MGRNSSTRPARFPQDSDRRRVCRGSKAGWRQVGEERLVVDKNGLAGHRGGDARHEELFRHFANYAEGLARCLRLGSDGVVEVFLQTIEARPWQDPKKVETQSAWHVRHQYQRRGLRPGATTDAIGILGRAVAVAGTALPAQACGADPLEAVSVAGLGWHDDQFAGVEEAEGL